MTFVNAKADFDQSSGVGLYISLAIDKRRLYHLPGPTQDK